MRYIHVCTIFIALIGPCLSSANAQDDGAVDPAPSGRETSETHVFNRSAVTVPGRDTDVEQTTQGNRQTLNFDSRGTQVPGHPDDTTIIDHRKRK